MAKGKTGFLETGEVYEAWHVNEGKMLWLKSGVAGALISSGDVLVLDPSADVQAVFTTTEGDLRPACVVAENDPGATQSIVTGAYGWFQAWGRCAVVNLMTAASRGDWLITSTTALKARPMGDVLPPPGAFGWVLTSGSTPEVFLFGVGGAAKPVTLVVDGAGGDYATVLAAASALGSNAGSILVKAGTYTETNTIKLGGDNQKLVGEAGAIIYNSHTGVLLSATGKSGIELYNLTFKDTVSKPADNSAIDLDGCTDWRVVDCDFRETYFRSIDLADCERGIIRGCTFASGRVADPGMETSIYLADCEHIEIAGNLSEEEGYAGSNTFIRLNDCNRCTITDNRQDITALASRGIMLYHSHHNVVANNYLEKNTWLGIGVGYASHFNTVTGNVCHNNSFEGIEFGEANIGNVIANNVCTAATSTVYGRGIFMEAQTEEGNTTTLNGAISNVATAATVADGSQLPSGNMLLKIGEEYIYFPSRSGDYVSGGVRAEAGTAAASHADSATITVLGPRDNVIEGNVCNWNKRLGIGLHHAYNCIISNNICVNNGANLGSSDCGLYLDNLTDCLIQNNRIADTRSTPQMWHGVCFSGQHFNVQVMGNLITGAATLAYDWPDNRGQVSFIKVGDTDDASGGITITAATGQLRLDAQQMISFVKDGDTSMGWMSTDLTLVNMPLNLNTGYAVDFDRANPNEMYVKALADDLWLSDRTAGSLALSDLYQTIITGTGLIGGAMAATITLSAASPVIWWHNNAATPSIHEIRPLTSSTTARWGYDSVDKRWSLGTDEQYEIMHADAGAMVVSASYGIWLRGPATRMLSFDMGNDYLAYDTSANRYRFVIGGATVATLDSGDLTVGGTVVVLADRTLTAGSYLTGGGDLTTDRRFDFDHSVLSSLLAGTFYTETEVDTFVALAASKSITLTAGSYLTGGGDLTDDRRFDVDNSLLVLGTRTLTGGTGIATIGDLSVDRTINIDAAATLVWTGVHTFTAGYIAANEVRAAASCLALYDAAGTAGWFVDYGGRVGNVKGPAGKLVVQLPQWTNRDTDSQHAIFTNSGDDDSGLRFGFDGSGMIGVINVLNPGVAWGDLILQEGGGKVGVGDVLPSERLSVVGRLKLALTGGALTIADTNASATLTGASGYIVVMIAGATRYLQCYTAIA